MICGNRTIELNARSIMKSRSQAPRCWEMGVSMRVPNDVIPSRRMWLAMPTP